MKPAISILLLFAVLFAAGCGGGPKSSKGFTLPDGDTERGRETFVALNCATCHKVSGVERPEPPPGDEHAITVAIGGEVSRIKTYGELVTSIINPSHRLATGYEKEDVADRETSKMTVYNDVMTVQQLIDLVAFLQSQYSLREYEPSHYPDYMYTKSVETPVLSHLFASDVFANSDRE